MQELEKVINALVARGKASCNDAIPSGVIKQGKPALPCYHHELIRICWKEDEVPQAMRDAKIVTQFNNKVDRSDCNNYRGIYLLTIDGKVCARVVLARL